MEHIIFCMRGCGRGWVGWALSNDGGLKTPMVWQGLGRVHLHPTQLIFIGEAQAAVRE